MKYQNWFDKYEEDLNNAFEVSASEDWKEFVNNSYKQFQESEDL